MSDQKTVPKGLRSQEVERGNFKPPPVPYIPVEDEVGEKVNNDNRTYKVKINDKTTINASVWTGGNSEQFLIHVISAMNYIERSKLFEAFQSFKTEIDKYNSDLTSYNRALEMSKEELKQAQEEAKEATTAQAAQANDPEGMTDTPTIPSDISKKIDDAKEGIEHWKGQTETLKIAIQTAQSEKRKAGDAIFALYENLLDQTTILKWNSITSKQIGTIPWTDLKGKIHSDKPRQKTVKSFKDCVRFHLLTVFSDDAAERQRFYINNHLKKPAKVTIRHFAARVEQLNSYISHLPGLVDSPKALPSTKRIKAYDEAELAQALLRMCPSKWQDQFNLTQGIIPQSLRNTIETLENIEQYQDSSKPPGKPSGDGKKGSDGKRKVSFQDEKVPRKKSRTGKYCDLCKKHGGAHMSHNTADCKKYGKDGSLKKGFKKPEGQGNPKGNQFATILKEGLAEVTKLLKDQKRAIEDTYTD